MAELKEDHSKQQEILDQATKANPIKLKISLWETIPKILVIFAGSTGFLSAAGFYVVHSYLFKVTQLFTYKVDAVVYLAAGINMILGSLAYLFLDGISDINFAYIILSIGVVLILLYVRSKSKNPTVSKYVPFLLGNRIYYILIGILSVFLIIYSFAYGWNGYEYSPRLLGGGMPARVILIFNQSTITSLGLPLSTHPTYPAQSQPVNLIMELSDGVLVEDELLQIPIIIKNELLYGMIDANPPTSSQQVAPVSPTPPAAITQTSP